MYQSDIISVVIPTLNAEAGIARLLECLLTQSVPPDEILVVDSASGDQTAAIARGFERTKVLSIRREDFDHGGTRDMALRLCRGDLVLFFTQDALPADACCIERLAEAVRRDGSACACGRQLAWPDAPVYEKLTRTFNYPAASFSRGKDDIPRLGIKAFFLSDVCAAYDRAAYLAVGGFDHPLRTNEDMLIAAKFLGAGYRVSYCAEACVFHSHRYTLRQEYARYVSIGMILEAYRGRLGGVSAKAEGVRYMRFVLAHLLRAGAVGQCFRFLTLCTAKALGTRAGKRAQRRIGATDEATGTSAPI